MKQPTPDQMTALSRGTNERYSGRWRELGYSPRTLGWGSARDQEIRFTAATSAIDLTGQRVLDWGCGFGDFRAHLLDHGIAFSEYAGADLNADLIQEARRRHGADASFHVVNEVDPFPGPDVADVVVLLGLANLEQSVIDTETYARTLLRRGFEAARRAVVMDFLSIVPTEGYAREGHVHYYDPATVLGWGLELSPTVSLHHDYQPIPQREFLVVVRR